jgi:DNA-damage-inducible protein J
MDEGLKREFDSLCGDLGLTMTAAFNVFAKAVVRQQRIPFELAIHTPNAETIAAIKEVEEMRKDPSKYKKYSTFTELLNEVEAEMNA